MFLSEPKKRLLLEWDRDLIVEFSYGNESEKAYAESLHCRFSLFDTPAPSTLPEKFKVDTGAAISLIPQRFWKPYAAQIAWLSPENDRRTVTGCGGMTIKTRLGYIGEVWLFDIRHQTRLLQRIVAECAFDEDFGVQLDSALLGIGGGSLKNGGLCLNYTDGNAWLVRS